MAAYATVSDVMAILGRELNTQETIQCNALLDEAGIIIDAYNAEASETAKKTCSVRMVVRSLGSGADSGIPMGATQGSMSALGYSQSWTLGTGASVGELYIGRMEKKLLGLAGTIGSYSPVQELVPPEVTG